MDISKEDLADIIDETIKIKQQEINRLKDEIKLLQEELSWAREKLKEAQERNRKLDWVLTQTIEVL